MARAGALPRPLRRRRPRLPRLAAWMPRSLFGRSLLIIVLPLVILQIVLVVIFYDRHWDTVSRWLAIGVAGEVAWLADQLASAPDAAAQGEILDDARRYFRFAVSMEPGARLEEASERSGFLPPSLVDQAMQGAFESRLDYPFRIDTRPAQVDRVAVYVQLDDGVLRVLPDRKRVDTSTTVLLVAWMIGASLLLIAIAIYFLTRQLRPIGRLARAADSFGKGRDPGDVRLEGAVEIRQASLAYNRMRQRILRHMSQRTNLLAAVSHDLSTPLTRMSLELEMMRGDADDPAAVDALQEDVEEMRRLVDAYLDFARGEAAEPMRSVPAAKLLARLEARAARHGQPVRFDVHGDGDDDDARVTVRVMAVERMLANLIDNAVKHAARVRVTLGLARDHVEIVVDDDGPGVPAADRERVFEPFYRGDGARRTAGGVGMGLTIARDVALAHGGGIELETSPLGGLRCRVVLPR
ncbi:MAG: HAMP domain-containing protein [Alphaproteobacteria bacterium]|jgi:two-component system osmolarity sensor histidine kinase EnvZ|nr:HAMP domain-containing protein [Alphaproteobacteria bacterium]